MQEFKLIYKILKILQSSMDVEDFDKELLTYKAIGISEPKYARLIVMLVSDGYIIGIDVWNSFSATYPRVALLRPEITLKGLEYLEENRLMKKAKDLAKGITSIIN